MERRDFLRGMAGILAAGTAPWIITTPGLLMPVRARTLIRPYADTLIGWDDTCKRSGCKIISWKVGDYEVVFQHPIELAPNDYISCSFDINSVTFVRNGERIVTHRTPNTPFLISASLPAVF